MADVAFYQLKKQTLEQGLFLLLEKAVAGGKRALVRLGSEEEMEALDAALWTLKPDAFLPHATVKGKRAAEQPVLLATGEENPNGAPFLFVLPGATANGAETFERAFVLFEGAAEGQVKDARALWKDLKAKGASLAYWTQSDAGAWEKQDL